MLFAPAVILYALVSVYLCKKKGWQIHYLVWGAVGGLMLSSMVAGLDTQTMKTMEGITAGVVSIWENSGVSSAG